MELNLYLKEGQLKSLKKYFAEIETTTHFNKLRMTIIQCGLYNDHIITIK